MRPKGRQCFIAHLLQLHSITTALTSARPSIFASLVLYRSLIMLEERFVHRQVPGRGGAEV